MTLMTLQTFIWLDYLVSLSALQEDQFVYATLQVALYLDSFTNSHPIQVTVSDPAQINEIFDKISYNKVWSKLGTVWA